MDVRRIPRHNVGGGETADVDPLASVDGWPHLKELGLCLRADFVFVESKYGRFERIIPSTADAQVLESPEADLDVNGRNGGQANGKRETKPNLVLDSHLKKEHYGSSPIMAYDPMFNWEVERALVPGQRMPGPVDVSSPPGTRFSVRILSMTILAGLMEPLYGTICLYHSDRKEKLSEDFHFQYLPAEWAGESTSPEERVIFSLGAQSPAVCLLVQLEKPATEESSNGIKSNVYSRRDPPHLTDKEADHLQQWAQRMPFRESFAWITIPLFDSSVTGGVGGFGAPEPFGMMSATRSGSATPGTPPNASPMTDESAIQSSYDYGGPPVLVDIPHLNRVKDGYTEDQVLDPKRKVHKPVRATMRFEIERLPQEPVHYPSVSTFSNGTQTPRTPNTPLNALGRAQSMEFAGSDYDGVDYGLDAGELNMNNIVDYDGFRALDFQAMSRSEPLSHLLHVLYVYPQAISLPKKHNLFIRVELRNDDSDIQKPAMEAMCPREGKGPMLRSAFSQVVSGARLALYHDEFKVRLPALIAANHHLLFTFFHIDLLLRNEPPRPTVVGYAVMPMAMASQVLKGDVSLPVVRDLQPYYLQEAVKKRLVYWEDGRPIFRVRTRVCSSILPLSDRVRDFMREYDRHILETNQPGPELLDAINSLKTVELTTLLQYLNPILSMLLCMIGNGMETLQVAAFRALVNIITRVQAESGEQIQRNRFLVHFVDYVFDDLGRQQAPVYPGLCNVWRSLARSKAKGYRVGPVYDEALATAWVILELIAKSMALELAQVPHGAEIARLRLEEEVYQCIWQLFDCLLTEVQERARKNLPLAKRLNSSIAFFCYDLLSVVDPPQVFELVGVYLTKFAGECLPVLHRYKLAFLRIICDHDFYIETPGRVPIEKNYLTTVLLKELFVSLDHEDAPQRTQAARTLAYLMGKHEFDARYQQTELKLYIAQLYFPIITMMLEESTTYNNLGLSEKRDILVCMLTIMRSLDDETLRKSWKLSETRTRFFFQLLEDSLALFQYKKPSQTGGVPNTFGESEEEASGSPKYSDRLSPGANVFFLEASRQDAKAALEREHLLRRMNGHTTVVPHRNNYVNTHALPRREAGRHMREALPAALKTKLENWEVNLSSFVNLQVLEILERFSFAASEQAVVADLEKMESISGPLASMLARNQSLTFWKHFPAAFMTILDHQGLALLGRGKDRFVKGLVFNIMRRTIYRGEFMRRHAVVCLLLILRTSLEKFGRTQRLKALLTITLSELIADVKLLQKNKEGFLQETPELQRLRKSVHDLGAEGECSSLLEECGLSISTLFGGSSSGGIMKKWDWRDIQELQKGLKRVLEASAEHARLLEGAVNTGDKCAVVESYYGLSAAYSHVPDLHIMWLLHLCEAHQESQSWAEAAQCAIAVAAVVMQALVGSKQSVWGKQHLEKLKGVCASLTEEQRPSQTEDSTMEGFGATNLTMDSAVKYLQMGNNFFKKAQLFHFCAELLELILPVHKSRHAYAQLARCHQALTSVFDLIMNQEASPIPFKDAAYYRVGFYGSRFGKLDRKEYIYREARDVRLGDIMEKLTKLYEAKGKGEESLTVIPDSRQVDPENLKPGFVYMQITAVEPVVGEEEDRWMGRAPEPSQAGAPTYNCFLFDTPFTENGKTQGGLEDQWKRRTLLYTDGSFPALVPRLLVVRADVREYSPIENAVAVIESRTRALQNELDSQAKAAIPRPNGETSGPDLQLPRLQTLQRLLQGSVALQVNSGVLGVCIAFLRQVSEGQPQAKDPSRLGVENVEQLKDTISSFVGVCKRAVAVHARAIVEDDREFHLQLVEGLEMLQSEIARFIPSIR